MSGTRLFTQWLMPGNRFKTGQCSFDVQPNIIFKGLNKLKKILYQFFTAKTAAGLTDKASAVQNVGYFIAMLIIKSIPGQYQYTQTKTLQKCSFIFLRVSYSIVENRVLNVSDNERPVLHAFRDYCTKTFVHFVWFALHP